MSASWNVLAMALVGAFAAAVSKDAFDFHGGVIFGVALAAYFAAFEFRTLPKLAIFVAACALARPAAIFAGFGSQLFWFGSPQDAKVALPSFFVGGFVGGIFVLGAGLRLFSGALAQIAHKVLLGSSVCGALGVCGAALDGFQSQISPQTHYLTYLWQSGTGLLLGVLLRWSTDERNDPEASHEV